MREVIVLSYLDVNKGRAHYRPGDNVKIPFTGVYLGHSVKGLSVESEISFDVEKGRTCCVFRVRVAECLNEVLIGKLNSIEFL